MKIRINDITEAGMSLDLAEDGKVIEGLAGDLGFVFKTPVQAHLDFTRFGAEIQLAGSMKAGIELVCSRCLQPFDHEIESDFHIFYTLGAEPEREKELTSADIDVNYITGDELDTSEILLAQLTLDVPVKPLCKEACLGLCLRCGADLNLGPCSCPVEEKHESKFAKLKGFKVK
ncbi:MAG: hypothetical protein A3J24_06975 [Deltaproteobacteria bacterium RIFCSPLOWO2_02_FULL_53_8]|nr:MAG: hypothetical protein A3J24_06975 [Deltaproteobacteria bacterium RIFCSPLOWO2_02_FULL_53_8]